MNIILQTEKKDLKFNLESFIKDGKFDKAMSNRWHSIVDGAPINGILELSLEIFEAEIIDILEKSYRTTREDEILNWTKKRYLDILSPYNTLFHTSMFIDSKLFKSPYCEKLFQSHLKEIENYKMNNLQNAGKFYKKLMSGEKLVNDEEVILFKFLNVNIVDNPEPFENIFQNTIKKILELNGKVGIYGKEFLLKYITYQKCKKLGLKMPYVYITDRDLYTGNKTDYNGQYNNNSIITIDYYLLNNDGENEYVESGVKNITKWIQVIYHELKHYKQDDDLKNENHTIDAWDFVKFTLLSTYLTKKDFKEYETNYKFTEIERSANRQGWSDTAQFLNTYSVHFNEEIESAKSLSAQVHQIGKYGMKAIKDDDGQYKMFGIERYNFENIAKIIKDHPQLLNEYKILNVFFDKNGIKDINRLIKEYSIVLSSDTKSLTKKEIIELYTEVFSYYFIRLDLSKIDLKLFTPKEAFNYFGMVNEIYQNECRALKDMMDSFIIPQKQKNTFDNLDTHSVFKKVGIERIRRIKKYYHYLATNMEYIQKLKDEVPDGYIVYKVNLNLKALGYGIASFVDRVEIWNTEFKDTEFCEELRKIPLIMDDETYKQVMNETKEQTYGKRR